MSDHFFTVVLRPTRCNPLRLSDRPRLHVVDRVEAGFPTAGLKVVPQRGKGGKEAALQFVGQGRAGGGEVD